MAIPGFHEVEAVNFESAVLRPVSELSGILIAFGFSLHEDVFSLDRQDDYPPWQHGSIVEVEILRGADEVFDLDGSWDSLKLKYLFASLPVVLIPKYLDAVFGVARSLNLAPVFGGVIATRQALAERFDEYVQDVYAEHGTHPGSEDLAILIQSAHARFRR